MDEEAQTESPKQLLSTLTCPSGHTDGWGYWDVIPRSREVLIEDDGTILLGDNNSNFSVHGRAAISIAWGALTRSVRMTWTTTRFDSGRKGGCL